MCDRRPAWPCAAATLRRLAAAGDFAMGGARGTAPSVLGIHSPLRAIVAQKWFVTACQIGAIFWGPFERCGAPLRHRGELALWWFLPLLSDFSHATWVRSGWKTLLTLGFACCHLDCSVTVALFSRATPRPSRPSLARSWHSKRTSKEVKIARWPSGSFSSTTSHCPHDKTVKHHRQRGECPTL